jgi:hypothetical protein
MNIVDAIGYTGFGFTAGAMMVTHYYRENYSDNIKSISNALNRFSEKNTQQIKAANANTEQIEKVIKYLVGLTDQLENNKGKAILIEEPDAEA